MKENRENVTALQKVVAYFKIALKAILYFFLTLFILNSILYIVLSIPSVQNKLIDYASKELSSLLNTKVSVSEVRLSLFNSVSLKDLYVEDQAQDTLVYANYLGARLSPINFLLKNELKINKVELNDFSIKVNAIDSISDYNFQFIIDNFSSTDSTAVDTSSSSLAVVIDDIKISNGRLAYKIKSDTVPIEGFNPSDIYLTDFNASVSIHSIDMNRLDIHVNAVGVKEKSGLEIVELKGHVLSDSTRIRVEDLFLALPNSHLTTDTLFYDTKTEEFKLITQDTEIFPGDLTPFLSGLKNLDQTLVLKAKADGKLPSINLENIFLSYGEDAILEGSAFISSYLNLGETDLGVNIDKLSITPQAIESFAQLGDESFKRPAMLDSLGRIALDAHLSGSLKNFRLESKARTGKNSGVLTLAANGSIDTTFTNFEVKANLDIANFNLEPFIGSNLGIKELTSSLEIDANQRGAGTLAAKVRGRIDSLELKHGAVESLPFAASYDPHRIGFGADAKLHFGQLMAGFEMTTADKPDIKFAMRIKDIDVAHFYQNKYWNNPLLNFDVRGEIIEFDIDNLNANILIKDLKFKDTDFNYEPGPITLSAWQDFSGVKHISLISSLFEANLNGMYKFSTLMDEYSELMNKYLPSVFPTDKVARHHHHENNFTFDLMVQNTEELGYIFDLPVDIVEPLKINGLVDTEKHKIDITGHLPLARTSSLEIKDVKLDVANLDSAFNIQLNSGLTMSGGNYDLALDVYGAEDVMRSTFTVDSDTSSIVMRGEVDAVSYFMLDEKQKLVSSFEVVPTDVQIGKFVMNILPARVVHTEGRTQIEDVGIGINDKKYLDVNGCISANSQDSLFISFTNAQVADILQGFNIDYAHAEINGNIIGTNLLSAPELYTEDLKISDITIYKDTLGTATINTMWHPEVRGILLASNLKQKDREVVTLHGITQPEIRELSLHMDIERLPIGWLKPFTTGLLSDISGDISSHFTIEGTYDEPVTEGFFGFNNTKIGIDYTNVNYYISDTIDITPDKVGITNLTIRDDEGNKGTVSAKLTHRNFKNMKYDLTLRANNLMVLNTQSRTDSLFYGKIFASGNVRIDGSDKGINLDMQLRNGKRSNLNVTIPQIAEASEYKSVVYINVPEEKLPKEESNRWRREEKKKEEEIPIKIKVKLDVDPNLNLAVVIDPKTGDRMTAKGKGTINFSYDMSKNLMTTYGNYNITDGGVRLNLQNISKLEFKIKEGSRLNFLGDPLQTKFDITAYRRVRADLRTLDVSFEQDNESPRVQVDCLLGIAGDINKMDLKYDIGLVGASEDQERKVKSLVNTDEIRIKQFAYLIASGTFYSNTGSSGANFSDGMWTSLASNALSSGLNAVFGSMLGENWELGADISDTDRSVTASTRMLDNRLKLSANVGMRSESTSSATDNSMIGDFDAEYMLNSTWTVKAYSHTNDRFDRQAATTQGVGIVYTREGPTFKRMFKSIGRRRGQWFRQERDSIRAVQDSIKVLEDSLQLMEKKAIEIEKAVKDSINIVSQPVHKEHSSKHGKVEIEEQPAFVEEEE